MGKTDQVAHDTLDSRLAAVILAVVPAAVRNLELEAEDAGESVLE